MSDDIDKILEEQGLFRCWCGDVGKPEEMFGAEVFRQTCGGTGLLYCECGGDFCVCHHHGEVDCDGCDDCRDESDDDWEEWEDGPWDDDVR